MNILVTGGKGYIGSRLVSELRDHGDTVFVYDIKNGFNCIDGIEGNPDIDVIVHLACFPRVGRSIADPIRVTRNNILSNSVMLSEAVRLGVKKYIFISSSTASSKMYESIREFDVNIPKSTYGLNKLYSEIECEYYREHFGLNTAILRLFNVYDDTIKEENNYQTLIGNLVRSMAKKQPDIVMYGNGIVKRDFCSMDDTLRAIKLAVYKKEPIKTTLEIGTGDNIAIRDVFHIARHYYPDLNIIHKEGSIHDMPETKAKTHLAERYLNWKANVSIIEGLNKVFKNAIQ